MIRSQKTIVSIPFHPAMLSNIRQLPEGVQLMEQVNEEFNFKEMGFVTPTANVLIRLVNVDHGEQKVNAIWIVTEDAFSLSEHIAELLAGTEEENTRFFENIKSKLTTGESELEQMYIQAVAEHHAKVAEGAVGESVETTEVETAVEEATEVKTEQ